MRRFWKRRGIEEALRARRFTARDEFVADVADRVGPPRRRTGSARSAVAIAMASGVLIVMSVLGGVGYASSAAHQMAATLSHVVSAPAHPTVFKNTSAADDEYCRGDDCHHHHHHHHHRRHHHHHHHRHHHHHHHRHHHHHDND